MSKLGAVILTLVALGCAIGAGGSLADNVAVGAIGGGLLVGGIILFLIKVIWL